MRAHTQVVTRCFGSPKETMLIPFADQANHHVTDNEVQFLNLTLTKKFLEAKEKDEELDCTEDEQKYFTNEKKRINFMKNFKEDGELEQSNTADLPFKSQRYAKKLRWRQEIG